MSHEIRTPLNGVVGMADLLSEEVKTTSAKTYLAALKRSAESLRAVINDILDYTKIESGRLDLDIQPFDLHQCIDQLCESYTLREPKAKVTFSYAIDPALPRYVMGDIARLRQVMMNLINNALTKAFWPGRLEKFYFKNIPFFLDGAHNVAGAQQLAKFLSIDNKKTWLIIGMLNNKTCGAFYFYFFPPKSKKL